LRAHGILPRDAQASGSWSAYEELARRLNGLGGHETKASVANKLSRGQFSAIFFIDTLRAIGIETNFPRASAGIAAYAGLKSAACHLLSPVLKIPKQNTTSGM
jgi:Domain of unknown function (DUF6471)